MKRIISFSLALLMILTFAGCAKSDIGEDQEKQTDYTTGTPWLDIDLDGVVTKDTPVDLKDNFALAVNKDKILEIEIPEGYSYGGTADVYYMSVS